MKRRDQEIVRGWRNPRAGGVCKLLSGCFCILSRVGRYRPDGTRRSRVLGQLIDVLSLCATQPLMPRERARVRVRILTGTCEKLLME